MLLFFFSCARDSFTFDTSDGGKRMLTARAESKGVREVDRGQSDKFPFFLVLRIHLEPGSCR